MLNLIQFLRLLQISNYEIPEAARKPHPASGWSGKIDPRQDFHYENNDGYGLKVSHLPWDSGAFSVKRYRITKTDNWTESESFGKGATLEMTNPAAGAGRGVDRDPGEIRCRWSAPVGKSDIAATPWSSIILHA